MLMTRVKYRYRMKFVESKCRDCNWKSSGPNAVEAGYKHAEERTHFVDIETNQFTGCDGRTVVPAEEAE